MNNQIPGPILLYRLNSAYTWKCLDLDPFGSRSLRARSEIGQNELRLADGNRFWSFGGEGWTCLGPGLSGLGRLRSRPERSASSSWARSGLPLVVRSGLAMRLRHLRRQREHVVEERDGLDLLLRLRGPPHQGHPIRDHRPDRLLRRGRGTGWSRSQARPRPSTPTRAST